MTFYVGTKAVDGTPMNRADYNTYRGWLLPEDEDGSDEGFLVEYADGGTKNHPSHKGYISWSPKDMFEKSYFKTGSMPFGTAISCLKKGMKVSRAGWNGKDMFLFLVPGSTFKVNRAPLMGIYPEGTEINYCPHIDMKTADGSVVPWLASQTDVLSEDWGVVD
jgi:hypothetical protein